MFWISLEINRVGALSTNMLYEIAYISKPLTAPYRVMVAEIANAMSMLDAVCRSIRHRKRKEKKKKEV